MSFGQREVEKKCTQLVVLRTEEREKEVATKKSKRKSLSETKRKKNQKIRFVYSKPVQETLFYLRGNLFITLDIAKEISGLNKYKTEHLLSDLILLEVIELELSESDAFYKLIQNEVE